MRLILYLYYIYIYIIFIYILLILYLYHIYIIFIYNVSRMYQTFLKLDFLAGAVTVAMSSQIDIYIHNDRCTHAYVRMHLHVYVSMYLHVYISTYSCVVFEDSPKYFIISAISSTNPPTPYDMYITKYNIQSLVYTYT